ncbi:ChaB family protein [Phormidium tenue FACHB-886]|nr:ChaB family protein [Phormidium tenue FACHB-886]
MVDTFKPEQTVSAVFQTEDQIKTVVQKLLDQGISRDHISVIGKDFKSETRISGFISKKDVILGGLRTGAVFGSLFGSLLGLLTGVGVLFIPFVGSVVAAGPIGAALLGAASGALAGSAGAGLASVLATLGMPEDKAAIYETRVQAGQFLVMAEVPAEKTAAVQSEIEAGGGEEIHVNDAILPRACQGECGSVEDLAPEVRAHLSPDAQNLFLERYNAALKATDDDGKAEQAAWGAIYQQFDEDEHGVWSKAKASV